MFDLASVLDNTLELRRRIESGKLRGPHVLTVGEPIWTTEPVYVRDFLRASHIRILYPEIPASLTTNPVCRFGHSARSGRIAKGLEADLVVLRGDPAQEVTAFSEVRYTIRSGKVIYSGK